MKVVCSRRTKSAAFYTSEGRVFQGECALPNISCPCTQLLSSKQTEELPPFNPQRVASFRVSVHCRISPVRVRCPCCRNRGGRTRRSTLSHALAGISTLTYARRRMSGQGTPSPPPSPFEDATLNTRRRSGPRRDYHIRQLPEGHPLGASLSVSLTASSPVLGVERRAGGLRGGEGAHGPCNVMNTMA